LKIRRLPCVQANLIGHLVHAMKILWMIQCMHVLIGCYFAKQFYASWTNLIDKTSVQGSSLLLVQPGSVEAGFLCSYVHIFPKHDRLQKPLLNPCK
jgi:hypothetical protein